MTMPRVVLDTATLVVALVAGGSALHGQSTPATAAPAAQPAPPAVPAVPATLKVPPGFAVSVFASGLPGSRLMAVSPEGVLVVAKRAEVVALPDANQDGVAEPTVLLSGMTYAHSVAFTDGYLYIGTTPAVVRVKWAQGAVVGPVETYVELPSSAPAMHTSRSIAFGPDGIRAVRPFRCSTGQAARAARMRLGCTTPWVSIGTPSPGGCGRPTPDKNSSATTTRPTRST